MPAPDPQSLWIERYDNGGHSVMFLQDFWTGRAGNRGKRAEAISKRLRVGDWYCRWCSDDLPDFKRADARYCCEACRKHAARARRAWRKEHGEP